MRLRAAALILVLTGCAFDWDGLDPRQSGSASANGSVTGGGAVGAGTGGVAGNVGVGGDVGAGGLAGVGGNAGTGGNVGGGFGTGGNVATGGAGGALPQNFSLTFGERAGADNSNVTSDTVVTEENPTHNFGVTAEFGPSAGPRRHALIRFDVSSLPVTAQVTSATLVLVVNGCVGCDLRAGNSVRFFELLEPWSEGTKDGAPGTCNWTERLSTAAWTTLGAGPGSSGTTIVAEMFQAALNTQYEVPLAIDVAQRWVSRPSNNNGLVMYINPAARQNDGVSFKASENVSTSSRPLLRLEGTLD